jgi:uncharacterized protein (UPF0333 family)
MVKGQVSLEYLMTYGIAIAIVVIAVAALYSMGVFSGGGTTVPPCSNCFGEFNYQAHTMSGDNFILEIQNGVYELENVSCSCGEYNCSINGNTSEIKPSTNFQITLKNVTTTTDATVNLSFTKSGTLTQMTKTQTISSDYFK